MLNVFATQFLALFAYFIMRLFVGGLLLYLGFTHYRHWDELRHILRFSWFPYGGFAAGAFAIGEIIIGAMLVAGAFTQIAALLTAALSLKMLLLRNHFNHPSIPQKMVYVLLLGASLSLFITGAGALAFDLPL